ncbi:MAG: ThuA domain-containing protein [Promethearchaeota archaeon]
MAKKKALITWGGWDGHTPHASALIMHGILEEEDYEVDMKNTLKIYTDRKYMESLDLIIQCWTMSKITDKQVQGLKNTVLDGCGFVGWHGGFNDSFRESTEYQFLTGSQWVAHPGGIVNFKVHILDKDDPIIAGISDFELKSEQYYIHVDPGILSGVNGDVLATTTFNAPYMPWDKVEVPVVYKRWWGDGKIFYASYGHTFQDFNVPEALEIMKRGMLWATREEE